VSENGKRTILRMSRPCGIEEELVARAREGESQAFEELVRMFQQPIYGFLYRLSGSEDDAMELTQSTFVKSWIAIGKFRGESSFRTYLYKIATNAWRNTLRDRSRRPSVNVDDIPLASSENPYEEAERSQELERLWSLVRHLPARQKEIVLLRIREGMPFEEAAKVMECSVGAAKASYHHAVGKLRTELKEKKP
jgi:RNA polymerase sigma-70 factor (ECF subfamily)